MAFKTVSLTRRSFSAWRTASGLAVVSSRCALAQDLAEVFDIADSRPLGQPVMTHSQPPSRPDSDGQVSLERRLQDGRPPSEWLRSMDTEELRAWLAEIEVPEAGVHGMAFRTHLTRDHMFQPLLIKDLTEAKQAKLHAAAHFGY